MLIRRETPEDVAAIQAVTHAAFAGPDGPGGAHTVHEDVPAEVALVEELRTSDAWLPQLSLVALTPTGTVIGHVLGSRGRVDSAVDSTPAIAVGPLSVHPDHQRTGVGSALMHTLLGAADAMDEPLVALLGEQGYFARFGFQAAAEFGVKPPVPQWREHFLVRALAGYVPARRGTFLYPRAFRG